MLQKDLRYRCLLKCLRDKGGWDCFFYLASILKYLTRILVLGAWAAGQQTGGILNWMVEIR